MGKDEKKTHYKFHRDQMNGSGFKIGGTKVGGEEIVEGKEHSIP